MCNKLRTCGEPCASALVASLFGPGQVWWLPLRLISRRRGGSEMDISVCLALAVGFESGAHRDLMARGYTRMIRRPLPRLILMAPRESTFNLAANYHRACARFGKLCWPTLILHTNWRVYMLCDGQQSGWRANLMAQSGAATIHFSVRSSSCRRYKRGL